jgi:hypothetical protein
LTNVPEKREEANRSEAKVTKLKGEKEKEKEREEERKKAGAYLLL